MKLEKFIEVATLLDIYSELLKGKQKEYLIEHFERDLSLTEIARKNDISRQAVYDNIKRGIQILHEYEDKLKFQCKRRKLIDELEKLKIDFNLEKLERIIEDII